MKNTIVIILIFMFLTVSLESFSQNKIDQSKNELLRSSDGGYRHERRQSHSSSSRDVSDDSFGSMIAAGVVQGFIFITYYTAIGNYEAENHLHNNISKYPFYNGISGNYENPDPELPSVNNLRFDLDEQFLYSNEDILGNHLKLKIRPFQFLFLQGDFFHLTTFDKLYRVHSNLSLFNFNVCYDRIRLEKFNFGWTLGVNYIGDEVDKAGLTYGLNTEIFISKYLSLFGSAKWSSINDTPVNEYELQGKYHISRYFLSAGYEHLKIATPRYNFLSIGGGIYF